MRSIETLELDNAATGTFAYQYAQGVDVQMGKLDYESGPLSTK